MLLFDHPKCSALHPNLCRGDDAIRLWVLCIANRRFLPPSWHSHLKWLIISSGKFRKSDIVRYTIPGSIHAAIIHRGNIRSWRRKRREQGAVFYHHSLDITTTAHFCIAIIFSGAWLRDMANCMAPSVGGVAATTICQYIRTENTGIQSKCAFIERHVGNPSTTFDHHKAMVARLLGGQIGIGTLNLWVHFLNSMLNGHKQIDLNSKVFKMVMSWAGILITFRTLFLSFLCESFDSRWSNK